jgi:hypothetical protein
MGMRRMDWEGQLSSYIGKDMVLWIEDLSGEKKTEPRSYALHKLKKTDDGYLKFYINTTQFLSVPIFEDTRTDFDEAQHKFISNDAPSQLIYRVQFTSV